MTCETLFVPAAHKLFSGRGSTFGTSWYLRQRLLDLARHQRRVVGRQEISITATEARVAHAKVRLPEVPKVSLVLDRPSEIAAREIITQGLKHYHRSLFYQRFDSESLTPKEASIEAVLDSVFKRRSSPLNGRRFFAGEGRNRVEIAPHTLYFFAELVFALGGGESTAIRVFTTALAQARSRSPENPTMTPRTILNSFESLLSRGKLGVNIESAAARRRVHEIEQKVLIPGLRQDLTSGIRRLDSRVHKLYSEAVDQLIAINKSPAALYVSSSNNSPQVIDRQMLRDLRTLYRDFAATDLSDKMIAHVVEAYKAAGRRNDILFEAVLTYLTVKLGGIETEKMLNLFLDFSRDRDGGSVVDAFYGGLDLAMFGLGYNSRALQDALETVAAVPAQKDVQLQRD